MDWTADDTRLLVEVVDDRLAELQDELAHTDDRDFRTSLRSMVERLTQLRARLVEEEPSPFTPSTHALP